MSIAPPRLSCFVRSSCARLRIASLMPLGRSKSAFRAKAGAVIYSERRAVVCRALWSASTLLYKVWTEQVNNFPVTTEAERSRFMPTIRERRMLLGKNSRDFGAIGESGFGSANACAVPEIQRASSSSSIIAHFQKDCLPRRNNSKVIYYEKTLWIACG